MKTYHFRMILPFFTHFLLTFSIFPKNSIDMFIEFSKHMEDLGINSVPAALEDSFGELGEDEVVVRRVYVIDVCHGPVPVVGNKLSLRIDK